MIWEIGSEICCLPASIEFPALLFYITGDSPRE